MAAFEDRQAEEIRDSFARHEVRYLFIGKSGAILLGFPDTTQDADIFVEKSAENGRRIVPALRELGFTLSEPQAVEIERGKDFIQLKNGPFDLDLIFAPDGIEHSQMPGSGGLTLRDSMFATSTTSLPAKKPPGVAKIWNPCHGSSRSVNIWQTVLCRC